MRYVQCFAFNTAYTCKIQHKQQLKQTEAPSWTVSGIVCIRKIALFTLNFETLVSTKKKKKKNPGQVTNRIDPELIWVYTVSLGMPVRMSQYLG